MRKFLHNKNSKILIITLVILTVMSVFSHNGSNIFSGAVNTVTKGLSTLTAGAASSDKSKEKLEKENEQLKKKASLTTGTNWLNLCEALQKMVIIV